MTLLAKRLAFNLILSLILLELVAAAFIHTGRLPARPPRYGVPRAEEARVTDHNPHFGAWYRPHRRFEHQRACFNVVYETNGYGAVDRERSREGRPHRTIVLGDSFAMGHGVQRSDRFSERLEAHTGVEHMNFGLSGANHIQYYLIYKHLAKEFSHDTIMVFVLPDNDFTDGPRANRYWPYWAGTWPEYRLAFAIERIEDSKAHPRHISTRLTLHDVLATLSYTYNAADWVAGYLKILKAGRSHRYAGYFDASPDQLMKFKHSMRQLQAEADDRRMVLVLIPRLMDFLRFDREQRNPLADELRPFAEKTGYELVDLLPPMYEKYRGAWGSLFLGCDGHWSPLGHSEAARIVVQTMSP